MEPDGNEAVEVCSRCGEPVEVRRIRLFDGNSYQRMQAASVRVIVTRTCPACLQTTEEHIEEH
jgi:hypothetical protein